MTTHEIIDETVAYYSEDVDRRSVTSDGDCLYRGEGGRTCAVGRCMLKRHRDRVREDSVYTLNTLGLWSDDLLLKRYRGHSYGFWVGLQILHDDQGSWSKNGLTERGLSYVRDLKEMFPVTP